MALLDSSSNVLTEPSISIYIRGSYGSNTLFKHQQAIRSLNTVVLDRFKSPNVLDGGIYILHPTGNDEFQLLLVRQQSIKSFIIYFFRYFHYLCCSDLNLQSYSS